MLWMVFAELIPDGNVPMYIYKHVCTKRRSLYVYTRRCLWHSEFGLYIHPKMPVAFRMLWVCMIGCTHVYTQVHIYIRMQRDIHTSELYLLPNALFVHLHVQ
jgi:hypothetical protein